MWLNLNVTCLGCWNTGVHEEYKWCIVVAEWRIQVI